MAMEKRENILANIAGELGEIANTTVKREVYDPSIERIKTIWGSSTYLLVLLDGEEDSVVEEKGNRKYMNHLVLQINGYTQDIDNPSETMNSLLASVKEKMEEDPTRNENAHDTQRQGVEILTNLEPPYAGFKLRYRIPYYE